MNRIKELRNLRGWSQTDVAKRVGVSQSHIQRYESGSDMRAETALAIADVFGVSIEHLLCLDGENTKPESDALSDDERDLVTRYRSANAQGRIAIQAVARAMSNNKTGLDVNIVAAD